MTLFLWRAGVVAVILLALWLAYEFTTAPVDTIEDDDTAEAAYFAEWVEGHRWDR